MAPPDATPPPALGTGGGSEITGQAIDVSKSRTVVNDQDRPRVCLAACAAHFCPFVCIYASAVGGTS